MSNSKKRYQLMPNLSFNILTFNHPQEEQVFFFTDQEQENLTRIHKTLVPKEVIEKYGEQEHYYTSFAEERPDFLAVLKPTSPEYQTIVAEDGEERRKPVDNSTFSSSVLKRYYNSLIHNHFKSKGLLVKPNFVSDTEIWLASDKQDTTGVYKIFNRFSLKVQFKSVSGSLELLVAFEGKSKIFKTSVSELLEEVPIQAFNWVVYHKGLYRFEELPDDGRREYDKVYPVWNFDIRDALLQETEAPDKSNRYKKFKTAIDKFYRNYLNTDEFKSIIPIEANGFISVDKKRIGEVL